MMAEHGDVDHLDLSDLGAPLLTDFMKSMALKDQLYEIGLEIMKSWVAHVPRDTGALRSTAAVKMRRVNGGRPKGVRWEAEFFAGGPRAPYAPEVEAQYQVLEHVLKSLGYR